MSSSPPERPNSPVFAPGALGPLALRNRIVKCGTNEGMARKGLVTERLVDWHRAFAEGGVAMTTLAYCAVSPEGRTFRDQVWMRKEASPGLADFAEAIHRAGARASIQLGHAGWFANPRATREKPLGPSRQFSMHAQAFSRAMTAADFGRLEHAFADAARLAVQCGFDAIEVHLGHGYLLSQFLSPYNNRRRDEYGGSLENRARFPRRVLAAVREAIGRDVALYPKLNMDDGFDGGLTLEEGVQVARWLEQDGTVDAIQLTGGHTTRTPMYLLRGDVPLRDMIADERDPIRRLGLRVFAPRMLKPYAFQEAFFLPQALEFRRAVRLPLMLLGGVTRLETMEHALEAGFDFVAVGRPLIHDPDWVRKLAAGETTSSPCTHCNRCIVEMERGGTRCVLDDPVATA
ncbi:MAG: NADH:flavin oxidoreductase [Proteobacteria bacterium]|nr:NADH:flavin oxidoreductase [Pseudomonadota bacterium]